MTEPAYTEYRLYDGTIIGGHNDLELVEAMAQTKFSQPRSRQSYRRATAKRVNVGFGITIDPSTDETLIADLVKHQLIKSVD